MGGPVVFYPVDGRYCVVLPIRAGLPTLRFVYSRAYLVNVPVSCCFADIDFTQIASSSISCVINSVSFFRHSGGKVLATVSHRTPMDHGRVRHGTGLPWLVGIGPMDTQLVQNS